MERNEQARQQASVQMQINQLRGLIEAKMTRQLPSSALAGAILLVFADTLARTAVSPMELPIGIITGALGGPFFLWLLIQHKRDILYI